MRLEKGFLVVFEGIDGSGKTTQARLLHAALKKKGLEVVLSKEPTDSQYGRRIRSLAAGERNSVTPLEEYRLFVEDRKAHVRYLIHPSLAARKIVILDRYYYSTMAYQGARGLDPAFIKKENESFCPVPEIVFLLDVPPRLGIRRIEKGRGEAPNLFEREDSLTIAREIFHCLKEPYVYAINAGDVPEVVHRQVVNVIEDVVNHYLTKKERYHHPGQGARTDHLAVL